MMSGSIFGLNNYYDAFVSPLKSWQVNPVANLMYGAAASNIYAKTVAKKASSTISSYLSSMNTAAGSLKTAAKSLSTSSFSHKAVTSSDNSSVTGTAKGNADIKTYSLTVTKLAAGQTNKGTELAANSPAAFSKGLNTFKVKSGGNEKTVAFTVSDKDTNLTALNKMAAAINKSGSGMKASIESGSKPGSVYIKLSSTRTGTDSSYSLTDTTGNAIAASGADKVSEKAQNAVYLLDGKQYESQSNSIELNNGKVSVTMNKADGRDIKLSVGIDVEAVQNDINEFVNRYNYATELSSDYLSKLYSGTVLDLLL